MAKIDSTNGLWVHATNLVTIGLPVQHTFDGGPPDAEWRIDVKQAGHVLLRFVDAREERFAVKPGDALAAVGEHLYLSLQIPPGTPDAALRAEDADEGAGAAAA